MDSKTIYMTEAKYAENIAIAYGAIPIRITAALGLDASATVDEVVEKIHDLAHGEKNEEGSNEAMSNERNQDIPTKDDKSLSGRLANARNDLKRITAALGLDASATVEDVVGAIERLNTATSLVCGVDTDYDDLPDVIARIKVASLRARGLDAWANMLHREYFAKDTPAP
jgi:hypothetical protein